MAYTNSPFVNYTKISPNSTNPRHNRIKKITIHHMAGNLSVEQCGNVFQNRSRQASSNYGIGTDGRIGLYVEEKNRAWTSGNKDNDNQAITIEVANDVIGGNWHVSDTALSSLINLCVDICQRNGIEKLNFTGDKNGNLTMHRYFQTTQCPGEYLASKFSYIADEVNKRLGISVPATTSTKDLYRVRKSWSDSSSQTGAYSSLTNAKAACKEGYSVFDCNGNIVYPTTKAVNKSTSSNVSAYTYKQFVKDVQKAIGAKVDGIAGRETYCKCPTISKSKNNRHAVVKPLQKYLNATGYSCGTPDGIAGINFDTAAKAWAKANGCIPDGEFTKNGKAWKRILKLI